MIKISVIIPLYNCEKYIKRCLDSVLAQNIKDDVLEIIVINDGSTDKSGAIADEYASRYDFIKVFHQNNQGVSIARNKGLEYATGDYVHFLDSDDFLLYDDGYSVLLDLIKSQSCPVDILRFYDVRVDEHNQYQLRQYYNLDAVNVLFQGTGREFCHKLLFEGYICVALYRTEFIRQCGAKFNPDVILSEDTLFNLELYLHANWVLSVNARIYGYFAHNGSATLNEDKKRLYAMVNNLFDSVKPTKELVERYEDDGFIENRMKNHGKAIAKRLIMLNAPLKTIKRYIEMGYRLQVFPISTSRSGRYERLLDILLKHPVLMWMMSFPFRHIVLPYIKPLIAKN